MSSKQHPLMATFKVDHYRRLQNQSNLSRKLRCLVHLDTYRSMSKGRVTAYGLLLFLAVSVFAFTALANTDSKDNVSTPPILDQAPFFDYSEFQDLPNNITKILKHKVRSRKKQRQQQFQHSKLEDHSSRLHDESIIRKGILQDGGEISHSFNRKKEIIYGNKGVKKDTLGHDKQKRSVGGSRSLETGTESAVYERNTPEVNHYLDEKKRKSEEVQEEKGDCPLKVCPLRPPTLVGRRQVVLNSSSSASTHIALSSGVREGGHWSPAHCTPRYRVAIIVPVRDRQEQEWAFLSHMHPFLQRQQLDYTIYIVEQAGSQLFNRAKLLNIGFVESQRDGNTFDCVVFHDVDMLPEDDRHLYHCSDMPRHLVVASSNDKYKSNLSFMRNKYFGGACMMTPRHVRKVNGWSNRYWGWGGEDDDMWRRVALQDLPVWRYPAAVARYTMLEHGPPPGINKHSYEDLARLSPHWRQDGLNSLHYSLVSITSLPHHTRILAHVGTPEDDPRPTPSTPPPR